MYHYGYDADTMDMGSFLFWLPVWYAVFLFSIIAHEFAHAFVAKQLGDWTAYGGGHVTLDPRPHIRREKIGLVVIPLITYFLNMGQWMIGWASVPYNRMWAQRYPKRAAAMAMVGPLTNLVLTLLALAGLSLMLATDLIQVDNPFLAFAPITGAESGLYSPYGVLVLALGNMFKIALILNLVLACFNALPIPPLDGSALVGLFLTHEQRLLWDRLGRQYWFIGLLVAWRVVPPLYHWLWGGAAMVLKQAAGFTAAGGS